MPALPEKREPIGFGRELSLRVLRAVVAHGEAEAAFEEGRR